MPHIRYDCNQGCPVEATLEVIGVRLKGVILHHLLAETIRYNELRRLMPEITQRMLTKQLRDLEAGNLISRKVYAEKSGWFQVLQLSRVRNQKSTSGYRSGMRTFSNV